jgi:hypothetical protein
MYFFTVEEKPDMRSWSRLSLLFCALLVTGCTDSNNPVIPYNTQIFTTAISPSTISISWNKATDTKSPSTVLVYKVYLSAANPVYQSFNTFTEVEAGTLVQTLIGVTSATISSGITAGNAYYINIVVLDEAGNKALYSPLGEFFHTAQLSYYPINSSGADVTATANHLVVATGLALPTVTADRFGVAASAYNFNPTTPQCLQSTNNVGITGNAGRSVSLWVQSSNTPAGTRRVPFAWGDGSGNGSNFGVYEDGVGNNWIAWLWGASMDIPTATAVTTSWEHWVIGYDSAADTVYTYKNGVVVNNGDAPGAAANTVDSLLYVGCGMEGGVLNYPYQGNIDDIRVFNQLLSSTEVANLYAVTQP